VLIDEAIYSYYTDEHIYMLDNDIYEIENLETEKSDVVSIYDVDLDHVYVIYGSVCISRDRNAVIEEYGSESIKVLVHNDKIINDNIRKLYGVLVKKYGHKLHKLLKTESRVLLYALKPTLQVLDYRSIEPINFRVDTIHTLNMYRETEL
jgi:hypothetical protein